MKKSILFLSVMNGAAWGGSEEWWYKVAPWMAANGYMVEVVWFFWEERAIRTAKLENEKVAVTYLHNPRNTKSLVAKIIKKVKLRKQLASIKWHGYDLIIINQGGFEDVIHSPFKLMYKKLDHYVLVFHNYSQEIKLRKNQKSNLQSWFDYSTMNLGASAKIFTALLQSGIEVRNTNILINPISFAVPDHPYPLPGNEKGFIFIMLAALDIERKAQDVLIKALANSKWRKRTWTLNLYGEGKDEKLLQDLIIKNGLEKNIFLKGHITDVKTAIIESHVLLQITNKDAMPLAVSEAMALGRPCVVSNVGDMGDWVLDGVNGFICPLPTEQKIDETLERLWNNQTALIDFGKHSFLKFREKYPLNYEVEIVKEITSSIN